jgi:hypothetical protein
VTIIERVVTYVPRTVWNLVSSTVCTIWMKVIGSFIEIVLSIIAWAVTFLVCTFTEPLRALESLLDLWKILTDALGTVFDLIGAFIDLGLGLVDDFNQLLDDIGDTLGPLGWLLAPWKAAGKLGKAILTGARDFTEAVKDVLIGALLLNPCLIVRGLADAGMTIVIVGAQTGFVVLVPFRVLGMVFAGGRDAIDRWHLGNVIVDTINDAFGSGSERARRSIDRVAPAGAIAGRTFTLAPYRMYLSSEATDVDLRSLHQHGIINLYALAGLPGRCDNPLNDPDGEVVYAGSTARVTPSDLRLYIRDGRGSTPEFWVFPIKIDTFKRHINLAATKTTAIGIKYVSQPIGVYRAKSPAHVPLDVTDAKGDDDDRKQQQPIFGDLGRNGTADDLSVIPILAHFHYTLIKSKPSSPQPDSELFGLTSWYRPTLDYTIGPYVARTGVSYRNRAPDYVFRWVLTHELGHYVGLDHGPWPNNDPANTAKRSLDEIMYAPADGELEPGAILFEFLVAGGEPRFTVGDCREAWYWMTHDGSTLLS